ncbi:conserved hypothetical protein [Bradyrhizobium sp. STM 3843]|nr:conserved hypothetical protein [Bradyrhizobium sp. STM 3843]
MAAAPSVAASPGTRVATGPGVATGGFSGGGWRGGNGGWHGGGGGWHGGGWHHRGGFWPGVAVGAALGSYAYYGGPDYYYDDYSPDYYTDYSYYDDSAPVAVAAGGDASYCAQRYRSYDPASGTYLGYDGLRHPCP